MEKHLAFKLCFKTHEVMAFFYSKILFVSFFPKLRKLMIFSVSQKYFSVPDILLVFPPSFYQNKDYLQKLFFYYKNTREILVNDDTDNKTFITYCSITSHITSIAFITALNDYACCLSILKLGMPMHNLY